LEQILFRLLPVEWLVLRTGRGLDTEDYRAWFIEEFETLFLDSYHRPTPWNSGSPSTPGGPSAGIRLAARGGGPAPHRPSPLELYAVVTRSSKPVPRPPGGPARRRSGSSPPWCARGPSSPHPARAAAAPSPGCAAAG